MDIFLLSVTDNLHEELRRSLESEIKKRGNRVAYISSEPQIGEKPYLQSTICDYSVISPGVQVDYFDLSDAFSDNDFLKLKEYGAIYLSGGNTFIFMDSARKRNLYPILKEYGESGGLLIGASAGAIMMTPSIDLASGVDENIPDLTDLSGFAFVDFFFHPHYSGSQEERNFLKTFCDNKKTLYICKNGDGVYYSNGKIKTFGDTASFTS